MFLNVNVYFHQTAPLNEYKPAPRRSPFPSSSCNYAQEEFQSSRVRAERKTVETNRVIETFSAAGKYVFLHDFQNNDSDRMQFT